METSTRLLALLGLLQGRQHWTGPQLGERLGVSARTVRHDIERLRRLDYPVDGVRGREGYYRLGVGAKLPPLLLDDEEAVAITVALAVAAGISGIEETSAGALAKLQAILPHRLRRQVEAVRDSISAGPENTGANVTDPDISVGLVAALTAAIRDREEIRFFYRDDEPVQAEPYRLVNWQRRWYLVGRIARTGTWSPYRLDWMQLRTPGGPRFTPAELPGGDYTAFVLREVSFSGWAVHARITVHAPAEQVLAQINPTVGVVEAIDERHCVLVTGADSVEIIAAYVGMLNLDFTLTQPPELVRQIRTVGERYLRAASQSAGKLAEPGPDRAVDSMD